jgi:putative heme-binding domain-containing protein
VELVRLLALGGFEQAGAKLPTLLATGEPAEVQAAAIEALRGFTNTAVATNLVIRWRFLAPAIRPVVVNVLLQRRTFHDALLSAVETGSIKPGELNLDLEQRRKLLRHSSPEIEARAAKLFGDEEYSNRKAVVTEWLAKLPATGDATRGRAIFEKACAQCHVADGLGQRVGPELTGLSHRSVEDLVSNILDPNMAINPGYTTYLAELNSGESETGILKGETSAAVTLLQAAGREVVLPRARIKSFASTGLSLMPEGLEAAMTPAELRDLVAFIQQRR